MVDVAASRRWFRRIFEVLAPGYRRSAPQCAIDLAWRCADAGDVGSASRMLEAAMQLFPESSTVRADFMVWKAHELRDAEGEARIRAAAAIAGAYDGLSLDELRPEARAQAVYLYVVSRVVGGAPEEARVASDRQRTLLGLGGLLEPAQRFLLHEHPDIRQALRALGI